jgi:IS30 family transposase
MVKYLVTHRYPASERESNESQNELVPYFIPKGTLMENISHEKVREIETWINEMPRKIFHWKIPGRRWKRCSIPNKMNGLA